MEAKLTKVLEKTTIPVLRSIHWFYLQQNKLSSGLWQKIPFKPILISIVILTSSIFIYVYARFHIVTMPEFSVSTKSLTIKNLPGWLAPYTKTITPMGLPAKVSIFEDNLPNTIANSYEKNPWVKKVLQIQKSYPNRIYTKLLLRRPCVVVKQQEKYYLSDVDGVRLPGVFKKVPHGLLVITGVDQTTPVVGNIWQDRDVTVLIRLVQYLTKNKALKQLSIKKIHIKKHPNPLYKRILLYTEHGTKIIWGRCFESIFPKVTAKKRISTLLNAMSHGTAFKSIDIRFGFAIVER